MLEGHEAGDVFAVGGKGQRGDHGRLEKRFDGQFGPGGPGGRRAPGGRSGSKRQGGGKKEGGEAEFHTAKEASILKEKRRAR